MFPVLQYSEALERSSGQDQSPHSAGRDLPGKALWGLDPLYASCPYVLIRHIEAMSTVPGEADSHVLLGRRPISRVEISGIIVASKAYVRKHSYEVDDGTGTIVCQCWYNQGMGGAQQDLTSSNVLVGMCNAAGQPQLLRVGTRVRIRGKLSLWRDAREIAVHMCKVGVGSLRRIPSGSLPTLPL